MSDPIKILVPHTPLPGEPSIIDYNGEHPRLFEIIGSTIDGLICWYSGTNPENWSISTYEPLAQYRTEILPGELIELINNSASSANAPYTKILRLADPPGEAPGDETYKSFIQRLNFPIVPGGLIDVTDITLVSDLQYMVDDATLNFDVTDKTRVMQGVPL